MAGESEITAWSPGVPGISEVFHAHFVRHAYPVHTHTVWTLLILDDGVLQYDLDRHEHGTLRSQVVLLPPHVPHNGRTAAPHGFRKRVLYLPEDALDARLIGPATDQPNLPDPKLADRISRLHDTLAAPGDEFEAQSRLAFIFEREPDTGSDSAAIRTTAVLVGDHYVLNGEKIFVTSGERADAVVVWATLDRTLGRAAIKSFVVEKDSPGFELVRLEHKLGIRASDTAHLRLDNVRVPRENLLGDPEINVERSFAGVMQTFDNTRPLVAAMAVGVARAALDETRTLLAEAGLTIDYDRAGPRQPAAVATFLDLEADYEAAYLLTLEAAWMADNARPNSMHASMAKAKAGRSATDIALGCVALAGSLGYSEDSLLEKWARDAKIMDIFEGTQQIQQLIVARRLLGKSSAELK